MERLNMKGRNFKYIIKKLKDRIFVFRDAVSEMDYSKILKGDFSELKEVFKKYDEQKKLYRWRKALRYLAYLLIILFVAFLVSSIVAIKSLPGDTLYPVKISFNERLGDVLAFSNKQQAMRDSRISEKRLDESISLVLSDKASEDNINLAKELFEKRARRSGAILTRLADDGSINEVYEKRTIIESRLNGYSGVMSSMSDMGKYKNIIGNALEVRIYEISREKEKQQKNIFVQKRELLKESAERQFRIAKGKIKDIQKSGVEDAGSKLYSHITSLDKEAHTSYGLGKDLLDSGDYREAFIEFQKTISLLEEINIYKKYVDIF